MRKSCVNITLKLWWPWMVSNVIIGRNQHITANAVQISIELFFIFKNLNFKKDDLIKNDDIKPDWLAIKCAKLWKRRKPTEIKRRLNLWQVNKFHEHCDFESWRFSLKLI